MSETMEKIYCCDRGNDFGTAALVNSMNGGFGGNNGMWFLLLLLLGGRGWNGWGNGNGGINTEFSLLQDQAQQNQNTNLLREAMRDNYSAMQTLAQNLNCDFNTLNSCCCDLKQAVSQVAGQVGFSAERVINAVNMGDTNIITAIKDCCCNTQQSILRMGYENQLGQKDIINGMQFGFDRTNTGLERGFSQIAYDTKSQTCEIIQNANANTQRLLDELHTRWNDEQSREIQDLKAQISLYKQTDAIFARLNANNGGCGCNNGCSGVGF